MHLCAVLTVASWIMEPFGEIRANFSLQLSSRTQFAKISTKELSPKINVKNIKTRVFLCVFLALSYFKISVKAGSILVQIILGKNKQVSVRVYQGSSR